MQRLLEKHTEFETQTWSVIEPALAGARHILIKQFSISTRHLLLLLTTSLTLWAEDCEFKTFRLHQSLLCDAVNCHLVKVTWPEMQYSSCLQAANGCSAPRTSGLVMRPSAAATKVFSVPISWLEISWSHLMPQPLEIERMGASNTYRIGWRSDAYFQSQSKDTPHFWCFRHKLLQHFDMYPACKYSLSVSSFSLLSFTIQVERVVLYWIADIMIANSRSSTQWKRAEQRESPGCTSTTVMTTSSTRNPMIKTSYKG